MAAASSADVIVADRRISRWVSAEYYGNPDEIEGAAFGVVRDGELIAGFAFHDWQPRRGTIELSAVATRKGWLTREFLRRTGGYAFGQLACRLLVVRTSEHNRPVRSIFKKLGGVEHVIAGLRGPNEAEVIITLSAEAWRDYEDRHAPTPCSRGS